jgi:hypothetical protein
MRGEPIGEARSSTIDDDESAERRQPPEEMRVGGKLPVPGEVRPEPRDEQEVDRPVADDLIGDVDAIRSRRVVDLRDLHGPYR